MSNNEMTLKELEEHKRLLEEQITAKKKAERLAVLKELRTAMDEFQIPLEEFVEFMGGLKTKRVGAKAKPKYQDPVSGKTWSGRGVQPNWLKGMDRDQYLIQKAEADPVAETQPEPVSASEAVSEHEAA